MCAWAFGDSYDCYAASTDAVLGYWDSGNISSGNGYTLVAGRFAGSQAMRCTVGNAPTLALVKASGSNDAAHHISVAVQQTAALSGTNQGWSFQLQDGTTNQCSVVFRTDGAILLTSATPAGTVLATYTGAVTAANTWFAFEIEVFISSTAGYMNVRKNGNTVNDFSSATNLNTRAGTANNYANRLGVSLYANVNAALLDDLLWRSDAASVPWVGDVRCYARMPAADASVQFARAPTTNTQATGGTGVSFITNGEARYTSLIPAISGTVGTIVVVLNVASTSNMKCSIFTSSGGLPTTVLGSATPITLTGGSTATFIFGTPVPVVKGTQYWIGIDASATSGQWFNSNTNIGLLSTTAYASFPVATPTTSAASAPNCSIVITGTVNAEAVNETLQDGTTSESAIFQEPSIESARYLNC